MRQAGWLLAPALLTACGDTPPAGNDAAPVKAPITAPVAPVMNDSEPDTSTPPPLPASRPKPLVSRETHAPSVAEPDYRAIGIEPFWAVTVRGSIATLERPDKPPMRFTVHASQDRRTIRYQGDGFTMTVSEGPCSDGMSDAIWSDRVQISFGQGTLKGCGGVRDDLWENRP
ncbi:MAG: membrane-like protein [Sphingobium sp.]|nr:MAG: membrane-like protein [Sphingobium sp.]